MITKLRRIINLAFQNFFRNAWLSLITLTIIIITLVMVNVMLSINYLKTSALLSLEDWIDISLSLKTDIGEQQVNDYVTELDTIPEIKTITIVTPAENQEIFKNNNPDKFQEILSALDANPFPYSLIIKAYNVDQYPTVLEKIQNTTFKENIESQTLNDLRDFIVEAQTFIKKFNSFTALFTLIFLVIGVIVIFNTIRVSIYTHREEVGIMKLVGATNSFVRLPFLIESILYSLVAAIITFILIYPLLVWSAPALQQFFTGINVNLLQYYQANFWIIFLAQFGGIAILNLAATALALRKYLRV